MMQAEINNKVVLSSSSSTREEAMVKIYDDPRGERGEESPFKICLSPQSQSQSQSQSQPKPKPKPQSGMREQQQNKNTMPTSKMNVCAFNLSCLAQHDPNLPPSKLPFAWKLYEMLETVHRGNNQIDTNIVSWVDDGTAFKVHKLQQFVDKIVPTYFKQTKYKSFQRQLYFYGFQRVSSSLSSSSTSSSSKEKQMRGQQQQKTVGSYRHPMFVRGNKTLCLSMVPKKNKSSKSNSKIKSIVGTSTATATTTTVTASTATAANKTNKKLKELKQKQNLPQLSQQSDETEGRDVRPRSPGRISMESNNDVVVLVEPIVTTTGVINTTSKDNSITTSTAPVLDDEPIPLLHVRKVDHHHHSHQTDEAHHADHVNKITNASFVDRQEQLQKQQREQFYRDLGLRDIHQYQHQHQPQLQPHQWQPQMNQHYHHHQQQQQQQRHRQCSRDDNEKTCCIFGGKTFHFL